jgi:hypothetical protein
LPRDGVPALREAFEVGHFFVIPDLIQQLFIAGEEIQPQGIFLIEEAALPDLEAVFLFHHHKIKPGIEWRRRSEGA